MVKQVGEQSMSMPEVTRMPEVLAWFDKSEVVRRLPPDFKLEADHALVRFDVDVDVSGKVTDVRSVTRPQPRFVHGEVVLLLPDAEGSTRHLSVTPGPVTSSLRSAVVAAAYSIRFRPAQHDGHPVPFRGLRLSAVFPRGDLMREVAP